MLEDEDYKIEHDWKNVDLELRELVAGCMSNYNWNRPPLVQLEKIITARIAELKARADAQVLSNPEPQDPNDPKDPIDPNNPTGPAETVAPKTKLNPESKEFVPTGPPPKKPLDPESKDFVPGDATFPHTHVYRKRVPMGEVEPDYILKKFYKDYFVDEWANDDKYAIYWSKKTLSSRPDSKEGDKKNEDKKK